jgi:hypothetical protein
MNTYYVRLRYLYYYLSPEIGCDVQFDVLTRSTLLFTTAIATALRMRAPLASYAAACHIKSRNWNHHIASLPRTPQTLKQWRRATNANRLFFIP